MESKHFRNFMGSLTELESLVEKDRVFVAAALDAKFQSDADTSLIRISETCQIASARVAATSEVHAAKIEADMRQCQTKSA